MSIETARNATREIVNLISDGKYDGALEMCSVSRLSEKDIEMVIQNYGCRFVRPPVEFDEYVDLVAIVGRSPLAWSIRAPLWTLEEGRSDLTLELTVVDALAGVVIELDDLRVL
ncbi:MAG: DUF7668 domain-containing protein [Rhodanobacter sp.]